MRLAGASITFSGQAMEAHEYQKLKEALRAQYELELQALEKFFRMSSAASKVQHADAVLSNGKGAVALVEIKAGKNPPPMRTGITEVVKSLLPNMPEEFTLADLAAKIMAVRPGWGTPKDRVSASGVLLRLCRKGQLEARSTGKGKSAPAIYKRKR